ncbi:MAG: hypothetical protein LBF28_01955 [Rickettsiales bacterium]|nr:hypothetical protein [Rickettsiales bacterium]
MNQMAEEYKRWQIENTRKALKNRRVVAVSGARQTGKTTLTRQVGGYADEFAFLMRKTAEMPDGDEKSSKIASGRGFLKAVFRTMEIKTETLDLRCMRHLKRRRNYHLVLYGRRDMMILEPVRSPISLILPHYGRKSRSISPYSALLRRPSPTTI